MNQETVRTGIVHLHSDYSHDGFDSLERLREVAIERRIGFVCLTDHAEDLDAELFARYVAHCGKLSDDTVRMIAGLEFRFAGYRGLHLLALGLTEWVEPQTPEAFLSDAAPRAGFTIMAHPVYPDYQAPDCVLDRIDAIEVWNAAYNTRYLPDPKAIAMVREGRRRRPELLGTAGLDQHDARNDREVRILLDRGAEGDPLAALRAGRFTNVGRTMRFRPQLDWGPLRMLGIRAPAGRVRCDRAHPASCWAHAAAGALMARRLRVLHTIQNLHYGGMERLFADTVRLLDRDRFESHVLALGFLGRFAEGLEEYAALHVAEPVGHRPGLSRRPHPADPGNCAGRDALPYGCLVQDLARRPLGGRAADRAHGARPEETRPASGPHHRWTRGAAHRRDRGRVRCPAGPPGPDRGARPVAYQGADQRGGYVAVCAPRRTTESSGPNWAFRRSCPSSGSVGRLERIKGYDVMVEAYGLLRQRWAGGPVPALVVGGDGSERPELEAAAGPAWRQRGACT